MLEYVFFDERPAVEFERFLVGLNVGSKRVVQYGNPVVCIAEDTAESELDQIEVFYDRMLDMNAVLFEQENALEGVHRAGISLTLSNGNTVEAAVSPDVLNRILKNVSHDELAQLVGAIVDAVENPSSRPFCQSE